MPDKPGLTSSRNRDWDEHLAVEFRLHSAHTKTARYQAPVGSSVFDLYVPLFALEGAGLAEPPDVLRVAIEPSLRSQRTIGFGGVWRIVDLAPGVCEYSVAEKMVNSVKYHMRHGDHTFSIYIPNEVFGDNAHPSRVFLTVFAE